MRVPFVRRVAMAGALMFACATLASAASPPKVLRYAFELAESGFDPVQVNDDASARIIREIFDAPLRYAYLAPPGTLEPNTAAAMPDVSSDFKVFTFKLKPGIYFTDDPAFKGQRRELTAADYVYAIKRCIDPRWRSRAWSSLEVVDLLGARAAHERAVKTGHFDYAADIPGIRQLDRYTFRVELGKSSPRFVQSFADAAVLGAVAHEIVDAYGEGVNEHPVGTGPFRLVEWRRSSRIVLERNPTYRDDTYTATPLATDADAVRIAERLRGRKLPLVDRVEVDIIEEQQPRWLAFLNAEHDYLERMPLLLSPIAYPNGEPAPALIKRGIRIERVPLIDVTLILFNMENPTIGGYTPEKVALRRALALAIDAREYVRTLYKGQAIVAQSPIMPSTFGYDPQLRTEMGETDVDRANAMLDAYGYVDRDGDGWRDMPDGSPLVFTYSTQPEQAYRVIDEIVKKGLDKLRIRTRFEVATWPEQNKRSRNGNYMAWGIGTVATSPDSSDIFKYGYGPDIGGDNYSRFDLPEYNRLYNAQDALPDGPERVALLRRMTQLLVAYMPMDFIVHRYAIDMTYPWVLNYRRWPFALDWWRYVDIDPARQQNLRH